MAGIHGSISYVLWEDTKPKLSDKELSLKRINDTRTLDILGLSPDKVKNYLLAVDRMGSVFIYHPNIYGTGFSAVSSTFDHPYNSAEITETSNCVSRIRQYYLNGNEKYGVGGINRAIVHPDYEEDFKKVAEALGLEPTKISEERI